MTSERHRHKDIIEPPDAANRFEKIVERILTVDKSELERREAEYQQRRATRDRPGPRKRRTD